jgi:murein L,D-transpeptidase YcbB/YkuD
MAALSKAVLQPKEPAAVAVVAPTAENPDSEIITGTALPPIGANPPVITVSTNQDNLDVVASADQTSSDSTVTADVVQVEQDKAAQYLLSLHPSHSAFAVLKDELAVLHQSVDDAVVVAPDAFVRPGNSHVEIPNIIKAISKRGSTELLERHGDVLAAYDGSELYSETLVDLVKDFQKENKLKPDGIIGARSVAKMSDVPIASKINRVVLAMERLRWHPRNFGNRYVFINQPAYRASYLSGGKVALSMKVVVGKPSNQTNFFYDKIERVVYNPYWGVPRSILVNEMLPKLRKNPGYLDQRGYEVTTISGQRISSSSVDWYGVGANFGYNVRQTPGPRNALGELKILFPNKHNIYMHDTPAKSLFGRSKRALSHGCVRLHRPRQMAAAVLGSNLSSIRAKLGAGHNSQNLKQKIPVYVAYFTAWPSSSGKVQYYGDMYRRDRQLLKAIKKTSAVRRPIPS